MVWFRTVRERMRWDSAVEEGRVVKSSAGEGEN